MPWLAALGGAGAAGAAGATATGAGLAGAGAAAAGGAAGTGAALGATGAATGLAAAPAIAATVPASMAFGSAGIPATATLTPVAGGALAPVAAPTFMGSLMDKLPTNFEQGKNLYDQFNQVKDMVGPGKQQGTPGQQGSPTSLIAPKQVNIGSSLEGLPPEIRAALIKYLR